MIQKITLFLLRITLGWFMFYAGITKVMNPAWSAEGYLTTAKHFSGLYLWFASPAVLPFINFINAWGLTLLGVSLILGVFMKYSAPLGAVLMFLYYLALPFINPAAHTYIVDEHVIYGLLMIYLAYAGAGKIWGLEGRVGK